MANENDDTTPAAAAPARSVANRTRPSARRAATQTAVRPTPKASLRLLLERLAPWRNLLLLVCVGVPIVVGSRIDAVRPTEAVVLALALPVVVIALALNALREARHTGLLVAFAVVGLAAVAIGEAELAESFFPGEPFGMADLSPRSTDREIRVPADVHDFRVEVDGTALHTLHSEARGRYEIELRRGGERQAVSGELSRELRTSRPMMRRGAPTRSLLLHDADLRDVRLGGVGPVTAHLVSAEGAVEGGVRVQLRKASSADQLLLYALGGLAVLALGLELAAARLQNRTNLAAAVAVLGVFAYHLAHRFNPSDPLATVLGGTIFALMTGGLGGWVLGMVGASFFKRPAAVEKTPA